MVADGLIPSELSSSIVIGRGPRRQICLCCEGSSSGRVFFNNFQFEETTIAADSFNEFINGMKPIPSSDGQYWSKASIEPWSYCEVDNLEKVAASIERGFEIDSVDADSKRPLPVVAIAASSGRRAMVKQLLALGADPNAAGYKEYTAMHLASWISQSIDILELLFDAGGNVNLPNKDGDTPILLSVKNRCSTRVFKWLFENGADIETENASNESALSALWKMKSDDDYEWDWKPKLEACGR